MEGDRGWLSTDNRDWLLREPGSARSLLAIA